MLIHYVRNKKAAAGGSFTDPTDLGAKLLLWLDMTDSTYLWDSGGVGTGSNVADGGTVEFVEDRSGNGHHADKGLGTLTWRASTALCEWASNELLVNSLSGLTSTCEAYVLLSTTDTTFCLGGEELDSNRYFGGVDDASSSTALSSNAGTPTYYANGSAIVSPTRDDLHTNWATGSFVRAGASGLDLSTGWGTQFMPMGYNTSFFRFAGDTKHYILTTSLTSQERSDLDTWLAGEA